jgi:hypothetical protein
MRVLADGATLKRVSRVALPPHVVAPIDVFVNGVRQQEGNDYRLEGRSLVFDRSLAREGRLGFWRWLWMFLGLVGTYRQNDTVDVIYEVGGRREVASGLPIEVSEIRSFR